MYIFFFKFLRRSNLYVFRSTQTALTWGATNLMRPRKAICICLSDLNLYLNTCGQLQLHKCLDGLGG